MKTIIKYYFLIPVCYLLTGIAFSQSEKLDKAQLLLKNYEIDSTITLLKTIDTTNLKPFNKARFLTITGKTYLSKDMHDIAFKNFILAIYIYKSLDSLSYVAKTNLQIVDLLSHQRNTKISSKPFLDEYIQYSKTTGTKKDLSLAYGKIAVTYLDVDNSKQSIFYFNKAIEEAKKMKDTLLEASFEFNKGVVYNTSAKKYDSALYVFKKVLPVFKKRNMNEYISYNYNNQAEAYKKLNHFHKAISFYQKADSLNLRSNSLKTKKIFYENIVDLYHKMGDFKNAFMYAQKLITIKDSIDNQSQNNAIIESENKYRASEKEKKIVQLLNTNLKSEASRIQNRNLLIGSLSFIIVGSIFVFLVYKNTKRKQHIAEQEREIEIQKTEKLLKEQELSTIDAMISGQEKERQRLANELHDNLGSTLATVKLHFQHLQHNKDNSKVEHVEELYTKTNALLDEAYQKVRTIAHEKNSGVMANQGLLPAVKKLAKKVSNGDSLLIEVQDYGLEERLDNALEISIFRMIQELITNTIKHAGASEIHISLTNHDSLLNIIVEDNGKGFDAKVLPQKEGMGLRNIEKKVEHLEGTFEIDATIGKGTNIIINIPI